MRVTITDKPHLARVCCMRTRICRRRINYTCRIIRAPTTDESRKKNSNIIHLRTGVGKWYIQISFVIWHASFTSSKINLCIHYNVKRKIKLLYTTIPCLFGVSVELVSAFYNALNNVTIYYFDFQQRPHIYLQALVQTNKELVTLILLNSYINANWECPWWLI